MAELRVCPSGSGQVGRDGRVDSWAGWGVRPGGKGGAVDGAEQGAVPGLGARARRLS